MKNSTNSIHTIKNFSLTVFVIFILTVFYSQMLYSQTWGTVGSGTNNHCRAMTLYNNKLIVGGDFTTAGGVSASRIAMYDGISWSALGTGLNGAVYSLCVYNNQLIVGGTFTQAGGKPVHNIARWNGTTWDSLAGGTNNTVFALTSSYNATLYAGGSFTTAGGIDCKRIASWNGTSWSCLGVGAANGVNNSVLSIEGFNSDLIVGGLFTLANGVGAKRIAKWNGTTWSQLGPGIDDGQVSVLYPFGSIIYVGGNYTTINGLAIGHIAQWNGTAFSSMVTGVDGAGLVNSIRPFDGILYVGGDFPHAGGVLVNNIAQWNGTSWSALQQGVESGGSMVDAVTLYQGLIFVAGQFATTAVGLTVNNIASWGAAPTSAPALISPTDGSLIYTRTPQMTWSAPHWAGRYNVQISTNAGFTALVLNDSSSLVSNFTVPSNILQLNTQYWWRVAGMNPRGRGPFTAPWSFTVGNVPVAPILISPANNSIIPTTAPQLTWNTAGGSFYYGVQVSADSLFASMLINDSLIGTLQYNVQPGILQMNNRYFWRVYGYNPLGRGPNSTVWSFTIQNTTGITINGNEIPKDYNLYQNFPNPFNPSTVIKFDIPKNSFVRLVVYDMLGREVEMLADKELNAGKYEVNWNAGNLASGIYYYKLITGKEVFTKKLILLK